MKKKQETIEESRITYVKIVKESTKIVDAINFLLLGAIGHFLGALIRITVERMWQ